MKNYMILIYIGIIDEKVCGLQSFRKATAV